ncbi:VCBS repeat-containing protein [Spongiivirga sp. MCCC 1A20706]|uniref:VCBS repeat-containing protein n=1 Tax=Spongiivirga sp. MCCC 1A20706 TaxID=3160963 RepID=UPI003977DF02
MKDLHIKLLKTLFLSFLIGLTSCESKKTAEEQTLFSLLDSTQTGISFANNLSYDNDFNVYKYRNFYNGGGVALGDINNDGLIDIYFTANQLSNKLYLNKGNFQFEDISDKSGTIGSKAWSTGVSMVDINADGLLDIYVCNSGDVKGDNKQNELFINNGDLTFTEMASKYGLDDKGFSTHASFFDFDKDGDLDVYLLNNSYQAIGSFNLQRNERPKRDLLGGDKLMENVNGSFIDISEKAGIYGSVIGFGLGVTVADVNNDNWEDIYVSNDFFERDYLYINNQNGTFTESLTNQMKSTSGASMGADAADVNNDGYNDIFITEMLPSEYERLKSVTTFEDWNKYQYNVKNGYYHQFTRNTLQLNNTNNTFSEISRLSGVHASDWSWGALFFDMNNNGNKDLFIANGIYRDLTDQDYLQYISNEEVIKSIVTNNEVDYARLIEIIPSNPVSNHSYINKGGLKFERDFKTGINTKGFSNGSAYGDLDNDGDLDLVVNNVNMSCFVYRNNTRDKDSTNYLKLVLKGENKNTYGVGSKIKLITKNEKLLLEQQPIRGFQSSMDPRPNFGLNNANNISLVVDWPSGKQTLLENVTPNQTLIVEEKDALVRDNASKADKSTVLFNKEKTLPFKHEENKFIDFHRDRLLYHMCSTEGPKMASADINGDGTKDLYIGGSKNNTPTIMISKNGTYETLNTSDFDSSRSSEDAASIFFDADNDGDQDLYVCSGGVEFSQYSTAFLDRLYFNDGKGNFTLSKQKLPSKTNFVSSSTVINADIDNDGDQDIFVGQRTIPLKFGLPGSGFILKNDGNGNFTDVTNSAAPDLQDIGMITDALFEDINGDNLKDLIIVGEFMGVELFINNNGQFNRMKDNYTSTLKGWWNTIHATDIDNDGDQDFILGNHGQNSQFRASTKKPLKLYIGDFDKNGFSDPILTFTADDDKDYPFALRHNLIDQLKPLKKKFPDYKSFKNASITDIFSQEQLQATKVIEANILESIVLVNKGNLEFEAIKLPISAQLSPIYAINSGDFDKDGDNDILLGGNLYNVKPEVGRYDATFGIFLENKGNLTFQYHQSGKGFFVDGEIRDIIVKDNEVIVSRNSDSLSTFKY